MRDHPLCLQCSAPKRRRIGVSPQNALLDIYTAELLADRARSKTFAGISQPFPETRQFTLEQAHELLRTQCESYRNHYLFRFARGTLAGVASELQPCNNVIAVRMACDALFCARREAERLNNNCWSVNVNESRVLGVMRDAVRMAQAYLRTDGLRGFLEHGLDPTLRLRILQFAGIARDPQQRQRREAAVEI